MGSIAAARRRVIATVTLNPSLDEWIALRTLRWGEVNRSMMFNRYPGGKGVNVSRVVRELGGSTVAYGIAGGADGAMFQRLLEQLGVPHALLEIAGSTRNNYKLITDDPPALTEINTPGPRVPRRTLDALRWRLLAHRPRPRVVALCGSLPPGTPAALYGKWIRALRRVGIPTVLDASGDALRHGVAARPWLIKPNRREAEALCGRALPRRRDVVEAAQGLAARGVEVVSISLGAEGAVLASREPTGAWYAIPPPVRVHSAVGAGDSLVAGFLVGWARGLGPLEAFRLGVACGTATAITPGTELCHRRDVRRLLPRVTIRRIA